MSWASKRRTSYAVGVILFFTVLIGTPVAYWFFTIPATCEDGKINQGETAPDKGGPCFVLDERMLSPSTILWARSFIVRDGSYSSVAYVQNPNDTAGVARVGYRFKLYDSDNVLVAEREGSTFIMPGAVTPIFEGAIPTGNRIASRTYVEFTSLIVWERMDNRARVITVSNVDAADTDTMPRVTASVRNTSVSDMRNVTLIAVVFDPAGNAFAASQTAIDALEAGESETIIFTWPDPFRIQIGRIEVTPLVAPATPKN